MNVEENKQQEHQTNKHTFKQPNASLNKQTIGTQEQQPKIGCKRTCLFIGFDSILEASLSPRYVCP